MQHLKIKNSLEYKEDEQIKNIKTCVEERLVKYCRRELIFTTRFLGRD